MASDGTEKDSEPNCYRIINNLTQTLSWTWTYSEAADCGWEWSTSNSQMTFATVLRPSDNINKDQQHADIPLQCNFNNQLSLSSQSSEVMFDIVSISEQTVQTEHNVSLADGFTVEMGDNSNVNKTLFLVGEPMTTKVTILILIQLNFTEFSSHSTITRPGIPQRKCLLDFLLHTVMLKTKLTLLRNCILLAVRTIKLMTNAKWTVQFWIYIFQTRWRRLRIGQRMSTQLHMTHFCLVITRIWVSPVDLNFVSRSIVLLLPLKRSVEVKWCDPTDCKFKWRGFTMKYRTLLSRMPLYKNKCHKFVPKLISLCRNFYFTDLFRLPSLSMFLCDLQTNQDLLNSNFV